MAKSKWFGAVLLGMAMGLLVVAPAFAALVAVNDLIKIQPDANRPVPPPFYGGGLFDVFVNDSSTSAFKTFCLETDENISWGVNFRVDSIGDAIAGGSGGPSPDPISMQTAYLYSRFYWGQLTGFDITSANDQKGVQEAIWFFEQETGFGGGGLAAAWVALANANATAADLSLVRAFNPVDVRTQDLKQSMLVYVPEPGTLGLLGLGLATVSFISRRRTKRME